MTQTATSPQRKPLLDEASFQQLLSAAYVLQEHNDRLRGKEFQADFAKNLAAIVETQRLIQTLQLDLPAAADLVAERVQKITNASGAAIGIIEKGQLFYRAGTGSAAVDMGTRVAPDSALSADCLCRGCSLHYPDVAVDVPARAKLFHGRGVKAFIAVPAYHAGEVAGVLELRFARANSFTEADLRSAELMAGLLSEAMVTASRLKWKEALASERQSMLEALERIKPQIERLGTDSSLFGHSGAVGSAGVSVQGRKQPGETVGGNAGTCSVCGSDFFDGAESFCGICGAARVMTAQRRDVPGRDIPTTSSPWLVPYGEENPANGNARKAETSEVSAGPKASTPPPPSLEEVIKLSAIRNDANANVQGDGLNSERLPAQTAVIHHEVEAESRSEHDSLIASENASVFGGEAVQFGPPVEPNAGANGDSLGIVPVEFNSSPHSVQTYPWGSARRAHQWLETVKKQQSHRAEWLSHQWQRRRANVYLVLAALILLLVISGWGIRPTTTTVAGNASRATKAQSPATPQSDLTLFERLLVNVGLAEAPPAPSYRGNPDTQVWVDVHTALYHCPGSDLYGKTADGKFSTQQDAQRDQFEPANRKVCP